MGNQQRPNACTASTSNNMTYQGNVRVKATSDLKNALEEQYKQVCNNFTLAIADTDDDGDEVMSAADDQAMSDYCAAMEGGCHGTG